MRARDTGGKERASASAVDTHSAPTLELWRGAADLCARVCACAAESLHTCILSRAAHAHARASQDAPPITKIKRMHGCSGSSYAEPALLLPPLQYTSGAPFPFKLRVNLAFTRYCQYKYYMAYIAIKGGRGGYTILRNSVGKKVRCGLPKQRGCLQITVLIRVDKLDMKQCLVNAKGQP